MNGFKLLAIIPLKDCDLKFRKNLQIGEIYKFYAGYNIELNENKTKIIVAENISENEFDQLYNLKNGIKVNISAVVGANGSGKSALIELLYYLVYAIGITFKVKQNLDTILTRNSKHLEFSLNNIQKDINKFELSNANLNTAIKIISKNGLIIKDISDLNDDKIIKKTLSLLTEKKVSIERQLKINIEIEERIIQKLNVAVVYETNNGVYSVSFFNSEMHFDCIKSYPKKQKENKFNLEKFFYSLSLNFSHHSLNSKTLGVWINSLFHKNDAYTTPVVINPMRNEGNYNINRELDLSKERLMSNIVYSIVQNKDFKLLDKYKVSKFIFYPKTNITIKKQKQENVNNSKRLYPYLFEYSEEEIIELESGKLLKHHLGIAKIHYFYPFLDWAIGYLEQKIPKLREQYPQLFLNSDGAFDQMKFDDFLINDKSHITKKIRQTINFIKQTYDKGKCSYWPLNALSSTLTINNLQDWLLQSDKNYKQLSPIELNILAHPGFFNIDFELKTNGNETVLLSQLSSGEQQMIFNINSIVYHLYNLQSIHSESNKNLEIRTKYKNINIVLDEIELYYHPEMQRKLISNLLESFELIKNKEDNGIETINVCLLTHSPFILSDIPRDNVLFLKLNKQGESVPDINNEIHNTFGANINEMLITNFFMSSTLGEYARKTIQIIVEFHQKVLKADNREVLEKLRYIYKKKNKVIFHNVVASIGDRVIQNILRNNLINIESILFKKNPLEIKRKLLTEEIEKLDKQMQKNNRDVKNRIS